MLVGGIDLKLTVITSAQPRTRYSTNYYFLNITIMSLSKFVLIKEALSIFSESLITLFL